MNRGEGNKTADKEGRKKSREEMKNIHGEKHTVISRNCYFHCLPSSFALCSYADTALPKSGKPERRFGSISSSSVGFFIEESMAATTKKQKHKRSILSRQSCFHFCSRKNRMWVLVCSSQSPHPLS